MKIVYIAHPIGGNVKANIDKIISIVRDMNMHEHGVVPFAPYIADCLALDDSEPLLRQRGIQNVTKILCSGFVDELRLYGNEITAGMRNEIRIARAMGIPIVATTGGLAYELDHIIYIYEKQQ